VPPRTALQMPWAVRSHRADAFAATKRSHRDDESTAAVDPRLPHERGAGRLLTKSAAHAALPVLSQAPLAACHYEAVTH
jgi:hypothetical protein